MTTCAVDVQRARAVADVAGINWLTVSATCQLISTDQWWRRRSHSPVLTAHMTDTTDAATMLATDTLSTGPTNGVQNVRRTTQVVFTVSGISVLARHLHVSSDNCGCESAYMVKPRATWWTSVLQLLWPNGSTLLSDVLTNSDFSWSAGLRCVQAFDVEQTTCTSVIDEHDITNVSAQIEDVPVPAVTVAVIRHQRLVLLMYLFQQ